MRTRPPHLTAWKGPLDLPDAPRAVPRARPRHRAWCAILCGLLALPGLRAPGQSGVPFSAPKPLPVEISQQQGLHYFLLENLDRREVAQRGTAGSGGFAFPRLVLPSDTRFRLWILQAATLDVGFAEFATPPTGRSFTFPEIPVGRSVQPDDDGDDLGPEAEFIMGTDPTNPDSDGDGVLDGAETRQGQDPLSGRAVRVGIIGSADTPGRAEDICAVNDLALVADGPAGLSVFNIFNAMNPVIVAQVDTPGSARAVACDGGLVAVADGPAGLAVIDILDPPAARVVRQLSLGSEARAVAAEGNLAWVGLANGQVVLVDLDTGLILDRLELERSPIQDLIVLGDVVHALTVGRLHQLTLEEGKVRSLGSVESPGLLGAAQRRLRLSAGADRLYAIHTQGFNAFDLADPRSPRLLQEHTTAQFGWKQIVANGSGLGLAALGSNSTDDGPHHLSLFDLNPAGTNAVFRAEFATPGLASAVAIYNGQAYVADSAAGLQVINYLAFDNRRQPPSVRLQSNFSLARAEEGKRMRVSAVVSDDVQVRNVEFYVDGRRIATDGNFPFVASFITPRAGDNRSFSLRARASDTGGNATWTDEFQVLLVPDATPPFVTRFAPATGAIVGNLSSVTAFFSEPIDLTSLDSTTLSVVEAGADGLNGTPDDRILSDGRQAYRDAAMAVTIHFDAPLAPGTYRILATPPLSDLRGNALRQPTSSGFRVFAGTDDDQDGVPDELEPMLGLRTGDPDSDGDGVVDGAEDFDRDGLFNSAEVLLGTDPTAADSDADGIRDGDEDTDGDGLRDGEEILLGTNPLQRDSDQDGWTDDAEHLAGSDPVDAGSRPRPFVVSQPPAGILIPHASPAEAGLRFGVWTASPTVRSVLPRSGSGTGLDRGTVFAQPPLGVALTAPTAGGSFQSTSVLAQPPVSAVLPSAGNDPKLGPGTRLAQPPATLKIAN